MNQEWLNNKINEAEKTFSKIKELFYAQSFIPIESVNKILDKIRNANEYFNFDLVVSHAYFDDVDEITDAFLRRGTRWGEWLKNNDVENLVFGYVNRNRYKRYLDSEPMEFDGDIIITDPCYIIRAEHHGTKPLTDNDWAACGYGSNMEALGIKKHMTRDTLYGDWSCTTFNTDTGKPIGEFCADAGLVSVFDLSEVLAYNPDFDYHINRKGTTTLIENFKGTVQFVVKHVEGVYEDTTEWWNKGDKWEDYLVEVVGHGVNKVTGEPINFVGKQTGL